jgi:CubicO group peptidase (beta-lactamase class C family)
VRTLFLFILLMLWAGASFARADEKKRPLAPENTLAVGFWKDGREVYSFRKEYAEKPHNIKSLAKGVLAVLIGIAREQGAITDLDEDVSPLLWKNSQEPLSWRALLTMRSGLPSTSGGAYGAWVSSPDWIEFFNGKPRKEGFSYSTGDSHLLAVALRKRIGRPLSSFAEDSLFAPLGIENARWDRDPQGNEFGGNNLHLTFADVSRIGQTLLREGVFRGKTVVPEKWIGEMWDQKTEAVEEFVGFQVKGFGYHWWIVETAGTEGKCALGYGGQFLCLFPERNAQFVILSDTPESKQLRKHYKKVQELLQALLAD